MAVDKCFVTPKGMKDGSLQVYDDTKDKLLSRTFLVGSRMVYNSLQPGFLTA